MQYVDLSEPALLVLRLTFGFLTFSHGFQKIGKLDKFAGAWSLSLPVATTVMLVQTVGGALIFVGLFTQLAAFANAVVNAGILYSLITKSDEPFLAPAQHSWSIGVAYLAMALAVAGLGSGAISLDTLIF